MCCTNSSLATHANVTAPSLPPADLQPEQPADMSESPVGYNPCGGSTDSPIHGQMSLLNQPSHLKPTLL